MASRIVSCHASSSVLSYRVKMFQVVCRVVPSCVVWYYVMSCRTVPCRVVPYRIVTLNIAPPYIRAFTKSLFLLEEIETYYAEVESNSMKFLSIFLKIHGVVRWLEGKDTSVPTPHIYRNETNTVWLFRRFIYFYQFGKG